jgi:hypothetical protein
LFILVLILFVVSDALDPVPNVRIALSQALTSLPIELKRDANFAEVIEKLKSDSERDVRNPLTAVV